MPGAERAPYFPLTGIAGFDLYVGADPEYYGTFLPPLNLSSGYEGIIHLDDNSTREITINFPLFSDVTEFYIGLEQNATLQKAPEYLHSKPIVFYGSSITQGACASRAGNTYESILSRRFHFDYLNLGFAGACHAEDAMID